MKFVRSWGRLGMKFKETKIGTIPNSWEVKPIKEITEIVTDYVANGSFASLAENVTYKNEEDVAVLIRLVDYNNDFQGKFVFIDEHAYEFLGKSKLYGDEIIISNVGANVGTVFRCPKLKYKMSLAPNSIMVKFKGNDDFYFHWLRGYNGQQMLKSIVTGSAQPKFNKTNFKEMLVPVPPIKEQNKIAAILNTIDEKISINKKINNNLELQADALYQAFFSPKSGTQGKIVKLDEYCSIFTGKKNANASVDGGKYKFFTCAPEALQIDSYIYDGNAIIVSGNGAYTGRTRFYSGKFDLYQRTYACTLLDSINPDYIFPLYWFVKLELSKKIMGGTRGSAIPYIVMNDLAKFEFVYNADTFSKYLPVFKSLTEAIQSNEFEIENLAMIRDTLLPKLMSGELDVSDIDI